MGRVPHSCGVQSSSHDLHGRPTESLVRVEIALPLGAATLIGTSSREPGLVWAGHFRGPNDAVVALLRSALATGVEP